MTETRLFTFFLLVGFGVVVTIAASSIIIVFLVSSSLIKEAKLHIEARSQIEQAQFDFEKRLCLIRIRLERNAQLAQRKADFAEKALADLQETRALLRSVRLRDKVGLRTFQEVRSVKQRFDDNFALVQALRAGQHKAYALFGSEAGECHTALLSLIERVRSAAGRLAEAEILGEEMTEGERSELEDIVWSHSCEKDKISIEIGNVMDRAYSSYSAALTVTMMENADG